MSLPLRTDLNGTLFGSPDAGADMAFDFPGLIAHAAKTRALGAGTLVGSGTVSNVDRSRGSSCLAERRTIETQDPGAPVTRFLKFGDRVRIALHFKNLDYEQVFIHLVRGGGEQFDPGYLRLNPQAQVPALADADNVIIQSQAIIEYLEESHPQPGLLPADPAARARVRGLAQVVACDIHPINNLKVLNYLTEDLGHSKPDKLRWYRHWIANGLQALEALLADSAETGTFCHGDTPGLADVFLVPQIYNARRFDCDLDPYPTLFRIDAACQELAPFRAAAPENQPDRE